MRERLVFEVTDRELDDGVLTMLNLDDGEVVGAVGGERVVLLAREQFALLGERADRLTIIRKPYRGLGDLRDRRLGVVA